MRQKPSHLGKSAIQVPVQLCNVFIKYASDFFTLQCVLEKRREMYNLYTPNFLALPESQVQGTSLYTSKVWVRRVVKKVSPSLVATETG